jgi:hypothetical protein
LAAIPLEPSRLSALASCKPVLGIFKLKRPLFVRRDHRNPGVNVVADSPLGCGVKPVMEPGEAAVQLLPEAYAASDVQRRFDRTEARNVLFAHLTLPASNRLATRETCSRRPA